MPSLGTSYQTYLSKLRHRPARPTLDLSSQASVIGDFVIHFRFVVESEEQKHYFIVSFR